MNLTPPQVTNKTNKPASITGNKTSIGEVVLLVIFIGIIYWYLIKPKYTDYNARKTELASVQADLQKLNETKDQIQKLYSELQREENKVAISLLDEAVPIESRTTRVYILMDGLVKNSGMTVGSMSVEPLTSLSSPGYTDIKRSPFDADRKVATSTISLTLTGTMDQFVSFLKILENNPRLFDVTSLDIAGGGAQDAQIAFKLVVSSFAYSK